MGRKNLNIHIQDIQDIQVYINYANQIQPIHAQQAKF